MGYSLMPYLVDEARVVAFRGSGDEALVEEIVAGGADQVAHNDACFADEIAAGAPTLRAALLDLAHGRVPEVTDHAFQYAYALELLCSHFGETEMTPDAREPASIRLNWNGVTATRELETFLTLTTNPVRLPDLQAFPAIGFFSWQQCERRVRGIPSEPIEGKDTSTAPEWWRRWSANLPDERATYVSWLHAAVARQKGLIAFYY